MATNLGTELTQNDPLYFPLFLIQERGVSGAHEQEWGLMILSVKDSFNENQVQLNEILTDGTLSYKYRFSYFKQLYSFKHSNLIQMSCV